MPSLIRAIATAVPEHCISQVDALRIAQLRNQPSGSQEHWMRAIYAKSGVELRHSVLLHESSAANLTPESRQTFYPDKQSADDHGPTTGQRMKQYAQDAPTLAKKVVDVALEQTSLPPSAITHLITVSCTGFVAPGFDIDLIHHVPLRPDIARTHIGFMGCHGAMNGLRIANHIAQADSNSIVLLCATELCSLHYQYDFQPDQIIANALFADGAAAMVITSSQPAAESLDVSPVLLGNGSFLFANTRDAMTWQISDHGFAMTLSPRVPELIKASLPSWLSRWLATFDLSLADIEHWAIHPGGPKIMDAVIEALELSPNAADCSRDVLKKYGNMSSPTSLFVLQEMQNRSLHGYCVMLGFGPGLAVEAALLKL